MTDETTPTTKRPRMTPEERVKRDRERLEASERKAAEARILASQKRTAMMEALAIALRNAGFESIEMTIPPSGLARYTIMSANADVGESGALEI